MDLEGSRLQQMQDPNVAAAQGQPQPKLDLGHQILHLRREHGWTRKELAGRAGTNQANISRLENGLLNPSVDMLQRVPEALGADRMVSLQPVEQAQSATAPV